jgi:hypothetical protein
MSINDERLQEHVASSALGLAPRVYTHQKAIIARLNNKMNIQKILATHGLP